MRDQTVGQADALSLALAEPDQHVRHRWILGLTLASLGMWMAAQTPLQVMLALQLQDITPRHKVVALAVVTGVGAISSALATPIVGMLSDRTAHGRRHRPVQRPPPPLDARHGRAGRRLHGGAGRAGHGVRRGPAVVLVQRVPERRVRQPERGHPGPRAGAAARHGVRLGGHADRARPGPRHRPGRGRPRPAPGGRLRHARGPDGAAGAAVRAVHPGLSARAARPGAVLLAPAGLVLLAQPAGVPRFRLGLADPLPDQPGHRHGHAVPALLPARRGALRAAVPRPDRGGRPAHPDPDLHRLRGARLDRRRGRSPTAAAAARCWSPCPAC